MYLQLLDALNITGPRRRTGVRAASYVFREALSIRSSKAVFTHSCHLVRFPVDNFRGNQPQPTSGWVDADGIRRSKYRSRGNR
jgi:hypothetical protein